jgi:hypothetical protein
MSNAATKAFALALFACAVCAPAFAAAADSLAGASVLHVDWQGPDVLPPPHRNHCRFEYFGGRPYCSDHCGSEYQLYYCSEISFGCCHRGRGYCDFGGSLRCHP